MDELLSMSYVLMISIFLDQRARRDERLQDFWGGRFFQRARSARSLKKSPSLCVQW